MILQSCSWEVELSIDCLKELYNELSDLNFDNNSQIIYKNLSVNVKRGKVRVSFFNSSCLNEHSISYFLRVMYWVVRLGHHLIR